MEKGIIIFLSILLYSCYVGEELPPDQEVWEYALPSATGMNPTTLYEIDEGLKDESFGAIKGLIIIKEDKLVFENYYENSSRHEIKNIGRLTFTVIALAVDIFLEQGLINDLDDPIYPYLPAYESVFEADPTKKQITFRHILSNKIGLSWDEDGRVENDYGKMKATEDWVGYILSKPRDTPSPGQRFSINAAGGIVLARIMQNLVPDVDLEDFLRENLFEKIGIKDFFWEKSPLGILNAANGLSLKTIDMTRLGYLMLLEGRWLEKRRVITRDWVFNVSSAQSTFDQRFSYGYGWKVLTQGYKEQIGLGETSTYYIDGGIGQSLFIVPEYEMIVSIAAENFFNNAESISFTLFFYSLQSLQPAAVN